MKTRIVLVGGRTVGRGFLEILDGKTDSLKKKHGSIF
jgi:homoserine dehydrogenase